MPINLLFQMNYYLPNFESDSGKTRDSLPGCETPLNSPFLGFVVNVNARCNPHRDVGDSKLFNCVVLPFGPYSGGQIVFAELGLVVEVPSGCFISFLSMIITHYNMEVDGDRYSLVCHTDKTMEGYVEHRNHWGHSLN